MLVYLFERGDELVIDLGNMGTLTAKLFEIRADKVRFFVDCDEAVAITLSRGDANRFVIREDQDNN